MKARRAALLLSVVLTASSAAALDETIVIEATKLVPPVLKTTTGQRVDFVNRSDRAVHVEFGGDGRQHHVVQMPAGGPIWVVFHRPGTHPYVVHVYERRGIRALGGVVEVVEDATHTWDSQTCGVIVMGECIEP
jgi:plastocyanin